MKENNTTMNITVSDYDEAVREPTLIITRGISNSGKSTWALEWLAEDPVNRRRSNRDNLRAATVGIPTYAPEEERLITELQHKFIALHLAAGRDVVVDDTNLKARVARDLYDLAMEHKAKFVVKSFEVSLEQALANSRKRVAEGGLKVEDDIIKDRFARFTRNGKLYPLPDFSKDIDSTSNRERRKILKTIEPYVADLTKPKAVIVDIDGTLTTGIHPDRTPYEWNKVGLDILNENVANMVRLIAKTKEYKILVTSGRDGSCRAETIKWLEDNNVPYDELFMREAEDMISDDVVKLEIFNREIRDNYNIEAVFDDRLKVVRAWYSIGLPVLRVGDPDADF